MFTSRNVNICERLELYVWGQYGKTEKARTYRIFQRSV